MTKSKGEKDFFLLMIPLWKVPPLSRKVSEEETGEASQ